MENEVKVFSSSIIRTQSHLQNNLYDILKTDSALPVEDRQFKPAQTSEYKFIPKNDKYYVSKKKNGSKVKTVREIRTVFESDVYSYLLEDLEKQKNWLLRKIKNGSSRDNSTKQTAISMLKSSNPISKTAWQMLMNMNPRGHKFSSQYVLWNGIHIQINGSTGGSTKFLCRHDISNSKEKILNKVINKKKSFDRKKQLLQNSLHVRFKPGPLTKKKNLDTSYQRHQFGEMQLVTLPKPGLDISPSYGKPLAPSINAFLQSAFVSKANGDISPEWAVFAVSMLGVHKNGTAVQLEENHNVTFNLDYKCSQNRILVRNNSDFVNIGEKENCDTDFVPEQDESLIFSEVKKVINKVIDSVDISLNQDKMYCCEEELREEDLSKKSISLNSIKDKGRRKFGGELSRLDVTVIRIPESSESASNNICSNTFCTLGCVCDSLNSSYNFKTHCGRIDCMFQCKCDFSKYKLPDSFSNDSAEIIRGLVNLDKRLGQTLAKEEHKFHQTVVVTDEKSILLNSRKRSFKSSTKYAEFYSNMPPFKSKRYSKKMLSVVCTNLEMKHVEPWCMVHNLYKCFCRGKFTETTLTPDKNGSIISKTNEKCNKPCENRDVSDMKTMCQENQTKKPFESENNETLCYNESYNYSARTLPYKGRKYDVEYYRCTNEKILDMERNDSSLQRKLMYLINKDAQENSSLRKSNTLAISSSDESLSNDFEKTTGHNQIKQMSSQKLVSWLETNYKKYRAQTNYGLKQPSLHPPKPGNMALYPWEFILSRYREKKNHFLLSKEQPYRIFMAVDYKHSMFVDCININDIALSDLDKFPLTVKNLLTNATDLKDNFCILCGMLQCWELIGSVTKINSDKKSSTSVLEHDDILGEDSQISDGASLESNPILSDKSSNSSYDTTNKVIKNNDEYSKWFVMTIENDFTQIQFYTRGFFVKYENIIKAINVAKVSGKTVKLSSQNNRLNNPIFGIYAVPSDKDNYVFIGPYEKDESLGIETIKSKNMLVQKRTRGTWITTNKIDNGKVIDNPLLYMPINRRTDVNNHSHIPNNETNERSILIKNANSNASPQKPGKEISNKVVKPITIRKTNGFYQLAPNGLLKQVPINQKVILKNSPSSFLNNSILLNKSTAEKSSFSNLYSLLSQGTEKRVSLQCEKQQETASMMDSIDTDSTSSEVNNKREKAMFILKPEEINKRSLQNLKQTTTKTEEIETDIENFLNSFVASESIADNCYIISDDEDNTIDISEDKSILKMIWIVCKNVENFGWISGMKNSNNLLSFEIPGFKFSNFYEESEAFEKLNQVLSRKLFIPKHIKLEWEVLETVPDNNIQKLDVKDLSSQYVLTKKGLRHKLEFLDKLKLYKNMNYIKDGGNESNSTNDTLEENKSIIDDLEETSQTLEEESIFLLEEMSTKGQGMPTLTKVSEDLRKELAQKLNSIKSNAEV